MDGGGNNMDYILSYLKPYYLKMIGQLTIKFTGTIMDLLLPWILAYMIDEVIPQNRISLILFWGGVMLLCAICSIMTNIVANRMAAYIAKETVGKMRHDAFGKMMSLSSKQVDEFTVPSLVSRMTTDTYHIYRMLNMIQRMGVRAPILLIGGIIVTLTLEPVLTLVLIGILPIVLILVLYISKKGIPYYEAVQKANDGLVRKVRESVTGIRVIKALSKVDYEKTQFEKTNSKLTRAEKKAGITMASANPMMQFLLNIGLVGVILVGAFRVNEGASEVGKIIAFLSYFTIILNAMMSITRIFVVYAKAAASAERMEQVMKAPEKLLVEVLPEKEGTAHIVFEDVSFSYNQVEDHLSHISFSLQKGESLGIIGATGAGKTTLIQLLERFYDVSSGAIYIEGKNIKSMEQGTLRQMFGTVFQNDTLFAESIEDNINFSRGLGKEEIERAARDAQASDFIEALDEAYEMTLSQKGNNLSGGQKQRLLIARALAARPEILILDDASSALDYKTDAALRAALKTHFKDTTTIIVAQRISTVMHLDHILVLEEGHMIGYGDHKSLLADCEVYREIKESQMGGDEDERRRG